MGIRMAKSKKPFNYYFLNKKLHPSGPKGFRTSIALLIVNKNPGPNKNIFLLIQQSNKAWTIPKEGIKEQKLADDFFATIIKNLGDEQGFKGIKVVETKPLFKQIAFVFDFDRQVYDKERARVEKKKGRPEKGKNYHLVIMEYRGSDKIPLVPGPETINYQWVNEKEAILLLKENIALTKAGDLPSMSSSKYNLGFTKKAIKTLLALQKIQSLKTTGQKQLL